MYREEVLSTRMMNIFSFSRRGKTVLFDIICVILLVVVYKSSSDSVISWLVENPCSDDPTLAETFKQINIFFKGSWGRLWLNMGFLIFVFLVDIAGLVEKFLYEKEQADKKAGKEK